MNAKRAHYRGIRGQQCPIAEMSEECNGLAEGVDTIDLPRSRPNIEADGWDKIEIDGGCSAAFFSRCYRR